MVFGQNVHYYQSYYFHLKSEETAGKKFLFNLGSAPPLCSLGRKLMAIEIHC